MPLVPLAAIAPPHKNPDDYAIVVGINDYRPGIPTLRGAVNDCALFCRWLVEPTMGGLNPANVTQFVSAAMPPEPVRNHIEDLLVNFFRRSNSGAWPGGRRLYLFFAGHGLSKPPPNQKDCGLVMADAWPELLRGLLGRVAADAMRLTGLFKEVMLVMDCCAEVSGPAELLCSLPSNGDPTLPIQGPFLHIHAAAVNATTAEKLLPDPLDSNGPESWQGVLTNTLLRGLIGAADASGNVTVRSLQRFIEGAAVGTPRIEFDDGRPAQPMMFGRSLGVPVKVALGNGATRFQVRDGLDFSIASAAQGAPATITLKPGLWLFDTLDAVGVVRSSQPVSVGAGGNDVVL